VAAVALVSLDPLALFNKDVRKDFVEKIIFIILTGRVGFLDPHQVSSEDVDAQLAEQGGLPPFGGGCNKVFSPRRLTSCSHSPNRGHPTCSRSWSVVEGTAAVGVWGRKWG
jgi:hypothetical protein